MISIKKKNDMDYMQYIVVITTSLDNFLQKINIE